MSNHSASGGSIRATEERVLNAWPAERTIAHDGWLLCRHAGYTRRANSVQPLYPSSRPLGAKIAYCEGFYTASGQDTVFKLTPTAQPPELDAALEARRYAMEAPTSVQVCSLPGDLAPAAGDCTLEAEPTAPWLAAFVAFSDLSPRHRPAAERLITSIVPEHRFVALRDGGAITAVALVVVEDGHAGVFDVIVRPAYRRRGLGRELMRHALHWAASRGARAAELAVVVDNEPAKRLYAGLGFREAYRYWYRVKRLTGVPTSMAALPDEHTAHEQYFTQA